ncbi:MAG: patatin-like phospholipase family protein [Geminicoccaceae bacterium]
MVGFSLVACSSGVERRPIPIEQIDQAKVPGIPNARYWADVTPENIDAFADELVSQWEVHGTGRDRSLLAISGGGENGAFTAGLMRAWSELGTRPEFTVITGVSTGALAAPFVFLGPDYDDELAMVYGGLTPDQIYRPRPWTSIVASASIADTAPLRRLIETYVTDAFIAEIAREHRRGRRLFVQTAFLEAQRAVVWDLGAIANSEAPNAPEVFRKALLASASIPVAFPPVLFEVEVDGALYDELHVDGGVLSQTIVLAGWQQALRERLARSDMEGGFPSFYLLRNARVAPRYKEVNYDLVEVTARSVLTLIYAQGVVNLLGAYEASQIRGGDYYATWIGADFDHEPAEPFDPDYMQKLAAYGYELMHQGRAWRNRPPIFQDIQVEGGRMLGMRALGEM